MKTFHKVWFLLFSLLLFSNCTRDDICSGEGNATPKLVIQFENKDIANLPKEVNNLVVKHKETEQFVWMGTANEIVIPLNTEEEYTSYILSYEDDEAVYSDEIKFSYQREEVYINRACGFKMQFKELDSELQQNPNPSENWISYITILNQNVENENKAHIAILH